MGGGHAHVQVLRAIERRPLPETRVTVIADDATALYSGMVPGFVAGQYRRRELEIDVPALATAAGVDWRQARVVGLDPAARRLELADGDEVACDLVSFNIGSRVAGLDRPGVRDHAIPTRPISLLVRRTGALVQVAREQGGPFRSLVVGGGAGGVELAFCLDARLRREGVEAETRLVTSGPHLLEGYPRGLRRRVRSRAEARGFELLYDTVVTEAQVGTAELESGSALPFDALLWVAGAAAPELFRRSGLATDRRGFALVRPTLQLQEHDHAFAVGDCATLARWPATPKAGVYAVRQGPVLAANLRARIEGRSLADYRPQADFLTLLNLGDGTAVGAKRGFAFAGRWVLWLKDRIDRKFMRRFQVDPA